MRWGRWPEKQSFYLLPIDHVPPIFNILRPAVLVLEIVGGLPNVNSQKRELSLGDRGILVGSFHNCQLPGRIFDQPRPTAAESSGGDFRKLFFKLLKASEILI